MRVKMFNRGKGWYVICNNYKDDQDKAYLNLFFAGHNEPSFIPNDRGFSVQDIDVEEAKFTSYQGKVGMTIFKYTMAKPRMEGQTYDEREFADVRVSHGNMGAEIEGIDAEDLPFM